jgi:hypothetical protein|nr:MAG TPA: hypothetical protein [Caudoviricetes sp.]
MCRIFLKHGYVVHGIDIQHCYLASKDIWKGMVQNLEDTLLLKEGNILY